MIQYRRHLPYSFLKSHLEVFQKFGRKVSSRQSFRFTDSFFFIDENPRSVSDLVLVDSKVGTRIWILSQTPWVANNWKKAVFRFRDILIWSRILGSVSGSMDPYSGLRIGIRILLFWQWLRIQQKMLFFHSLFLLLRSHKTVEVMVYLNFCACWRKDPDPRGGSGSASGPDPEHWEEVSNIETAWGCSWPSKQLTAINDVKFIMHVSQVSWNSWQFCLRSILMNNEDFVVEHF